MSANPQSVILMADDDADDRLLAKDALLECELADRVRFVEDGEELMDYLLRRGSYTATDSAPRPGLILLDLNMPRKDGREAGGEDCGKDDYDPRRGLQQNVIAPASRCRRQVGHGGSL